MASFERASALERALAENAYFVKYKDKLAALKASDPATYERRLELIHARSAPPAPVPLAQGVDVAKLRALDAAAVASLWRARYSTTPGCVSAAIPGATWRGIAAAARARPLFLYPLPGEDAWTLYVGQWRGTALQFCALADYQRRGAAAAVVVVLQHFDELLESHDLALMLGGGARGAADDAALDARELQLLAYLVQYFHTDAAGLALLAKFHASPGEAIHLEIIAAAKRATAPPAD